MTLNIDVLVVDDSQLMQRIITTLLESDPAIRVVGTAADGYQAIEQVRVLSPGVVLMDVQMPRLDGLAALQQIMQQKPTPVVVLSGINQASAAIRALELGAVEFVAKPSGPISIDLYKVRDELIEKVKLARLANLKRPAAQAKRPPLPLAAPRPALQRKYMVAIASSAGGPQTLDKLFRQLPAELPACVLVAQHMPAGFTASFARRLDQHSPLRVVEARDGQSARPGVAYIAPGGVHMAVAEEKGQVVIRLLDTPTVNAVRPSADVLMTSVAQIAGACSVGVVLTGMGKDGSAGLGQIKRAGGITLAQDQESSIIFGMPKAAIGQGVVDQVLPLANMAAGIVEAIQHLIGWEKSHRQQGRKWLPPPAGLRPSPRVQGESRTCSPRAATRQGGTKGGLVSGQES